MHCITYLYLLFPKFSFICIIYFLHGLVVFWFYQLTTFIFGVRTGGVSLSTNFARVSDATASESLEADLHLRPPGGRSRNSHGRNNNTNDASHYHSPRSQPSCICTGVARHRRKKNGKQLERHHASSDARRCSVAGGGASGVRINYGSPHTDPRTLLLSVWPLCLFELPSLSRTTAV